MEDAIARSRPDASRLIWLPPTEENVHGYCSNALEPETVQAFVDDWIAAWNRQDLEAVMAFCDDDIEFVSAFLVTMYDEPSGHLHGKAALRKWFEASMNNGIHIEPPLHVLTGVDSAVLVESISGTIAANVFTFGDDGLITRSVVHG